MRAVQFQARVSSWIADVATWIGLTHLQLNTANANTEVIWYASTVQLTSINFPRIRSYLQSAAMQWSQRAPSGMHISIPLYSTEPLKKHIAKTNPKITLTLTLKTNPIIFYFFFKKS